MTTPDDTAALAPGEPDERKAFRSWFKTSGFWNNAITEKAWKCTCDPIWHGYATRDAAPRTDAISNDAFEGSEWEAYLKWVNSVNDRFPEGIHPFRAWEAHGVLANRTKGEAHD
jgi:hypothetical protein